MKKIYDWLVQSSADPAKLSLTVRGFIPFLLLFGVDQQVLDEGSSVLVATIVGLGMVASGAVGAYGLVRKILLSSK